MIYLKRDDKTNHSSIFSSAGLEPFKNIIQSVVLSRADSAQLDSRDYRWELLAQLKQIKVWAILAGLAPAHSTMST